MRLKQVCTYSADYGLSISAENYVQDGVPLIRTSDFDDQGRLRLGNMKFVDPQEVQGKFLQPGDVLFSRSGTIGRCMVFSERIPCTFAAYLVRFRPNARRASSRFIYYWSQSESFRRQISAETIESTIGNFNGAKFANLYFPSLDVATQKAIAAFLDRETACIDQLIEKKQRLVELLEEKRTSEIEWLVSRGLGADTTLKPTLLKWAPCIPNDWTVFRLRDLSDSLQTGPFGSQLHAEEYVPDGYPVINPSHLVAGRIQPSRESSVDHTTWQRLTRHHLCNGDIVFARRGKLGRCALVTEAESGWVCGTGSLRMRPRQDRVRPSYLIHVLGVRGISDWLSLQSVGSTMENLNTGILSRLPVPLPPLPEQGRIEERINERTSSLNALLRLQSVSIERLKESRSSLITAAVTGQLDIEAWSKRETTDRRLEAIEELMEQQPEPQAAAV
jgi:type I restriction enzyme, S subunit